MDFKRVVSASSKRKQSELKPRVQSKKKKSVTNDRKLERVLWNNKSTDQIRFNYCIKIMDCDGRLISDLSWLIVDFLCVDFRPSLRSGMKIEVWDENANTWSAKNVANYDASKSILKLQDGKTYSTKMQCLCLSTLYTHTLPEDMSSALRRLIDQTHQPLRLNRDAVNSFRQMIAKNTRTILQLAQDEATRNGRKTHKLRQIYSPTS